MRNRIGFFIFFLSLFHIDYVLAANQLLIRENSGAMLPSIKNGEIFVIRDPGHFSKIYTGEIVAYLWPKDPKITYIGRVVAVPGNTIEIKNNTLYLNGKLVHQKFIGKFDYHPQGPGAKGMVISTKEYSQELGGHHFHIIEFNTPEAKMAFGPYRIPYDCYFVMGDNRDNSDDSRFFGCVAKPNILGKIILGRLNADG